MGVTKTAPETALETALETAPETALVEQETVLNDKDFFRTQIPIWRANLFEVLKMTGPWNAMMIFIVLIFWFVTFFQQNRTSGYQIAKKKSEYNFYFGDDKVIGLPQEED
jgi:hypothetical protein